MRHEREEEEKEEEEIKKKDEWMDEWRKVLIVFE